MEWVALIAWLATATGGSLLLTQWLRHGGRSQSEGIRPGRLFLHAGLAATGLILWILFLITDASIIAWTAVAVLIVVATVGIWMLVISTRGRTRTLRTATPAEGTFPIPLVIGHGALGGSTLVLSALAAAGIG